MLWVDPWVDPFCLLSCEPADWYRVQMDVPDQAQAPLLWIDQHRLESSLKKVPCSIMLALEPNAIADVEPLNGAAKIGLGQFRQQMVMVIHQDKRVQAQPE